MLDRILCPPSIVIMERAFYHATYCRTVTVCNILPVHCNFAPILADNTVPRAHCLPTTKCSLPLVLSSTPITASAPSHHLHIKRRHRLPFRERVFREIRKASSIATGYSLSVEKCLTSAVIRQLSIFDNGDDVGCSLLVIACWLYASLPFALLKQ